MVCNPEAFLMSMGEHLLSMFWLNFHVKCTTRRILNEPQVLGCTSMDVYGLSHQAHDCSFFFPVTVVPWSLVFSQKFLLLVTNPR
jgi:hypothetical protein